MKTALIDIPVLLIFFARPDHTSFVFNQIKLARPSKLYLYQDGVRPDRLEDLENIQKCRSIVEDIDWDCKVYKYYQDSNIGCDPSEFISQKWMFEKEEYGIVLEDDDIPSLSFFPFCKELLERYKNDERINMICGMNHLESFKDYPYSYIFTTSGSIWGWASWKRVVDKWEEHYDFLNDLNALSLLKNKLGGSSYKRLSEIYKKHKYSGRAHYESILESSMILNSRLNIVPAKNMISNIGIGKDSTHSVDSIKKLPKGIQRVFFMKTYEIEFPIKHPKYIIEDVQYKMKIDRIMGNGHNWVKLFRLIERYFLLFRYRDFSRINKSFKRRIAIEYQNII